MNIMADMKSGSNGVDPRLQTLQESIKLHLSSRLSSTELVSLPLSTEFLSSDLRFTEYQRPVREHEAH
jgi:hypothetical protein